MKNSAKGLGYSFNKITKDLNRAGAIKSSITVNVNDAWRKAKEDDPKLEFRTTFIQFKKKYLKEQRKKK